MANSAIAFAALLVAAVTVVSIPIASPANGVGVYLMMPLDLVDNNGNLNNPGEIKNWLSQVKSGNVDGVMTDVWWGLVEKANPRQYDWHAYIEFMDLVKDAGLKAQVVMSFHQCGGNVGDKCNIPLPPWVTNSAGGNDIFYKDQQGNINQEYLSLGIDNGTVTFEGRGSIQIYQDFMADFANTFRNYSGTIVQAQVSCGPAGELRYPSYPLAHWTFPGIGEFQCYDANMLSDLERTAAAAGHPEWSTPPTDAGNYNNMPGDTGFFRDGGSYQSDQGKFFLTWYSQRLIEHGDLVLGAARTAFQGSGIAVAAKISGVHWWFKSQSHAAELTAGYYTTSDTDGYSPILSMFKKNDASVDFTCMEMRDSEQPSSAQCGPEELVRMVKSDADNLGVNFGGENALPRYDNTAYSEIEDQSRQGTPAKDFTYLRLSNDLLNNGDNWNTFTSFVNQMHNI